MNCKNCSSPLETHINFCSNCGAKVIRNRLNFKNLWVDAREQFLNYDNKLLKTFLTLFRKPEDVIGSYITGTRKKYVNVLSYFAIALTLSGFQLFILRKFFPESMDLNFITTNESQNITDIDWAFDYYSIFAFINLPMYALIGKLTFLGLKKFNYTEHLVITTYAIAQFSITNLFITTPAAMLGGNFFVIANIMNLLVMIYVAYIYKKLYPLTIGQIILRTLLFLAIIVVILILVGIVQFAFLYFSGDLEEMIRAEREKKAISYIASSIINWTS